MDEVTGDFGMSYDESQPLYREVAKEKNIMV